MDNQSSDAALEDMWGIDKATKDVMAEFLSQGGWDGPWKTIPSQSTGATEQGGACDDPGMFSVTPKDDLKAAFASSSAASGARVRFAPSARKH